MPVDLVCPPEPDRTIWNWATLAAWLNRDRVLLFPSGFQANISALTALSDRHTTVLVDRLIHHSILAGIEPVERGCNAL